MGVKFANNPKCLNIGKDVLFLHPQHISFGEKCSIGQRAALCPLHKHMGMDYPSNITIGNNVSIGAYDRIASAYSVVIEDDVLMGLLSILPIILMDMKMCHYPFVSNQ